MELSQAIQRTQLRILLAMAGMGATVTLDKPASAGYKQLMLPYSPDGATIEPRHCARIGQKRRRPHLKDLMDAIRNYIDELQWADAPPGQPGATWLELLIDFELDKGIRVPHTLEARSSIVPVEAPAVAAIVRTFRLLFKDVLSSRFHPETAAAFGPKNARGSRLRPLAVSTALAAAGVVPLLPRGRALDVAAAIREIVGGDFVAARAGIEAGTAGAIVKALSLKVPPKWRAHANMHDLPAGNLLSAFREDPGVSQDRFFLA